MKDEIKEILDKLTAESTEWENKFYIEAKKNDKAIEMMLNDLKEINNMLNSDIGVNLINNYMEQNKLLNKYLNILQGSDKDDK